MELLLALCKQPIGGVTKHLFVFGIVLVVISLACGISHLPMVLLITTLALGALSFLAGIGISIWFSLKNPDKLRSESFEIKNKNPNG